MNVLSRQADSAPVETRWVGLFTRLCVGVLCLVVLAVLAWAMPRGFDITDEGFYVLNYRFPAEYETSFSTFHLIVTRMLGLTNASVLIYRIVGLTVAGLGATVFGLSLAAWLRVLAGQARQVRWLMRPDLVVAFVLLGTLLAFSVFPRTISYNGLSTFLLLLSAAATLAALRCGIRSAGIWLLAAGCALGLDVFIKVSTGILLTISTVALLGWCWRGTGWRTLLWSAVLLGVGLCFGLGLYFVLVESPVLWWHNLAQESAMLRNQGGYALADLLPKYLHNAADTLRVLGYPVGPPMLALVGLAWWWPRRLASAPWHGPTALLVLGSVSIFLLTHAWLRRWYSTAASSHFETMSLLLAILVLVALVVAVEATVSCTPNNNNVTTAGNAISFQVLPVALWLLALPFLAAAGTINDLRTNLLIDMAPWFGLLLLLLALPRPERLPAWVAAGLLLLPAGFAAEQIIWGTLWTPYNLSVPMVGQTQPLRVVGVPGTLWVDTGTAALVHRLDSLLAQGGFRPGDPLLAFYDIPGLVYLCGGISPGAPWYFSHRDVRNCHSIGLSQQPLFKACILLNQPLSSDMKACLLAHGLHFPDNYRLVGQALSSFSSKHKLIQVYVPLVQWVHSSSAAAVNSSASQKAE